MLVYETIIRFYSFLAKIPGNQLYQAPEFDLESEGCRQYI